ncbi:MULTISPECIES: hypothetical protein [unclassified Bradyrhizobium]|uniref:hypothetical protein n=1 Tax=unclassified Bradyrhizobium TaxID=2631580 RepID=UPI00339646FD
MLNVARSLGKANDAASVQWQEASADKLPLPDSAFDVAYGQFGPSSSPTSQLLCAKCAGFYLQGEGSPSWCGAASIKVPGLNH